MLSSPVTVSDADVDATDVPISVHAPPAAGAALVQALPLEVSKFPDVPGATSGMVEEENQSTMLNQNIIGDAHLAIIIDNAKPILKLPKVARNR